MTEMHKVAHDVYVAVPDGAYDPKRWRPGFEAAAGAVGAALFGRAVLMGMAAARLHRVVPRARARAELAVHRRHAPVELVDRQHGVVAFVERDVDALDVQPVRTELGEMLVTTPEQTLVDLAVAGAETPEARQTMKGLGRKVDWAKVDELAAATTGDDDALLTLATIRDGE